MKLLVRISLGVALVGLAGLQVSAAPTKKKPADVLAELQEHVVRKVDFDLCWPATSEEYAGLGKNAVMMLTASSVIAGELPLRAAYIETKGVRVPLQRIAVFEKHQTETANSKNTYTTQVSFYFVPIYLTKKDARLLVDFSGDRKAFGVTSFSAKQGLDRGVPAFVRLDEYDSPSDPNFDTVTALLEREYPNYFRRGGSE